MPPPPSTSTSRSRRRNFPASNATPADSRTPRRPYEKILFPANGSPQNAPRILHSPSHATLDPIILDLVAYALRAFVTPWYNGGISRDPDKDFLQAVTAVVIHVIQALEVRFASADWTELLLRDLPTLVNDHYRDWDLATDKARTRSAHNLSTDELFHNLQPHVAISLEGTPAHPKVDPTYLRTLVDHLLKLLLPPEDYRAETERAIVREVLVGVVFGSVFGKVAQPWFLHGVIAKVLESREAASASRTKGSSFEPDSSVPAAPSILDQTFASLSRLVGIASSTLSSMSNLFVAAKSTTVPRHYSLSPPLHSHLVSLALSILPRSRTLSQLAHYVSLPLAFMSDTLDAFFYRSVTTAVANEHTVETVLQAITKGMFPNDGWPAPKEPDPDEQGQRELEQRCEHAVARLLPPNLASWLYPAPDPNLDDSPPPPPSLLLARHVVRPLSSHVANVHLFVLALDLVVGKLFPELVDNPEE